ncbi:MAG: copper(I)-binding protein [Candidatus Endobugula sp.]|jgi:copper(I)-binding protein
MFAVGVQAHDHSSNHASVSLIHITNVRVNPIFAGMPVTAAYFTIHNKGDKSIRLVTIKGAISKRIEIHEHTMSKGLMKMQEVEGGVELPAGETIAFQPGGYHIMIMDLNQDIKEADVIDLTLKFDDHSIQTIKATAKKPSMNHSSVPDHHGKHHDKNTGM